MLDEIDFGNLCDHLGLHLENDEFNKMFEKIDKDKDGVLSKEECLEILTPLLSEHLVTNIYGC